MFWMFYDMTTIVVTRDHQLNLCRSSTCGHSEAVCGVSQSGTTCLVNYDECRPRVLGGGDDGAPPFGSSWSPGVGELFGPTNLKKWKFLCSFLHLLPIPPRSSLAAA